MAGLTVKQVKSAIGANPSQRKTLESLGLGRIGASAELPDTPQAKGQIRVVSHLVEVSE
jgi:large subunit ribosomal protein L30